MPGTDRIFPDFKHVPKAELHVHIEGTLNYDDAMKMYATHLENGHSVPDMEELINDETKKVKVESFGKFLEYYDKYCKLIKTEEDVYNLVYDYLMRCADEGVIYAEIITSYDHYKELRTDYSTVELPSIDEASIDEEDKSEAKPKLHYKILSYSEYIQTCVSAIKQAREDSGIEARILEALLRHNDVEACCKTVNMVLEAKNPYVVGVNLVGDEYNNPPEKFEKVFQLAKRGGLSVTVHVGEDPRVTPESIIATVDMYDLKRIGHGTQAARSEEVIQELRDRGVTLECSPGSNYATEFWPRDEEHPVTIFDEKGLLVTLNSDDPAFDGFRTVGEEYDHLQSSKGYTNKKMCTFTRNAVNAAFIGEALKDKLNAQVSVYETYCDLVDYIQSADTPSIARDSMHATLPSVGETFKSKFEDYLAQRTVSSLKEVEACTREGSKLRFLVETLHEKQMTYNEAVDVYDEFYQERFCDYVSDHADRAAGLVT